MSFEGREGGGPEDGEPGGDGGVEEIRRVDEEIESKVRRRIGRDRQLRIWQFVYQWRLLLLDFFSHLTFSREVIDVG